MKKKLIILSFCLSLCVPLWAAAALTRVQVMHLASYERIIFSMNAQDAYRVFALSNPNRIVVDLAGVHLKTNVNHLDLANSLVKSVRSGWPKAGTLRVVFDVDAAVQWHYSFVKDPNSNDAELLIDLYPTQKPQFVADKSPIAVTEKSAVPRAPESVSNLQPKVAPIKAAAPVTPVSRATPVAPVSRVVTVVIDAGHGGKDPGSIGSRGTKEKDVVLAIALRLAELINKEPNMRAVLTRKGDYFVGLRDRIRLARRDKATLFVAVHADSFMDEQSRGVSVYALSRHGATSEASRWLAQRENTSELGGVDLGELGDQSYVLRSVLIDLAQTATIVDSLRLGTELLHTLDDVTKLHFPRVEQAPFVVLKSPDIPSVLVETGYLSNPQEEEHLRQRAYRDKLAQALLNGIQRYMKKTRLSST